MSRKHKKVPGATLHKRPLLLGTRESKYTFLYRSNFMRTLRLKLVKKQEQAKNNFRAEITQKQFLLTTFTRSSSTKCKCGSQTNKLYYFSNHFMQKKPGTLLFCSPLLSDKMRTALEQFKAEIGRKLKTILVELILPCSYKKKCKLLMRFFLQIL